MPIELSEHDIRTARRLITDALHEDLRDVGDLTSQAVLPAGIAATVNVVCREHGRLSGIPVARMVFGELDAGVRWKSHVSDGEEVRPGTVIASVTGPVRSLLSGERTALNFLTHLSGVATLTDQFVQAIAGTSAVSRKS